MPDTGFLHDGPVSRKGLWRENHGNLILAVMAIVFAIGALVLWYQQTRFREPAFPDSRSIVLPPETRDNADPNQRAPSVIIRAIGSVNDNGRMMVAIYDTANEFNEPTKAILKRPQPIKDGTAEWSVPIKSLPASFAIAAYHDENEDGTLNRNPVGFPTERYGFSNKARGTFGPPTFDQAVIERPEANTTIDIYIR